MAHFKMKFFGSAQGAKSKRDYHFSKGEFIEAEAGEFPEAVAEDITADVVAAEKEKAEAKAKSEQKEKEEAEKAAAEAKAKEEAEKKAKEEAEAKAKANK